MSRARRKLCASLAVLFILNILIIVMAQNAQAVTYQKGSTGSVVTTIQDKLSRWGYYSGKVDGVYGSKTVEAVKYFQKKNGLAVDGKCGPKTLAALGINVSTTSQSTSGDVDLLARLISAEARGEPYTGQVAVGAVVLNRVKNQDGQFWKPVADSAYRAARDALNGSDPSGGAIYYFNPATATSRWIWSRPLLTVIGKHRFCA